MSLYQSDLTQERWHLVRKFVLLFLLVLAAALGLVILLRQGHNVPLVLFNLFADAGLGILIGIASRIVLRRRHWIIQAIASAAFSIIGLALLGYFTASQSGIGPLELRFVRVNWVDWAHIALRLPLGPGRTTMDLLDLAHVVVAVDTSWLALRAWRRRTRVAGPPAPSASRTSDRNEVTPARLAIAPHVPARQLGPRTGNRVRPLIRQRRFGRPLISRGAAVVRPARSSSRRKNPFGRKLEVQLAAHEEHRCPYCLEDVKRNDARGTVECPVCHTLHHKDCWDITGTCQVPHLNT